MTSARQMELFLRQSIRKRDRICGPFGLVQGCDKVRSAPKVSTFAKSLADSANQKYEVAVMFSRCDYQKEDVLAMASPVYVVCANNPDSRFCSKAACFHNALPQFRDISIPNSASELRKRCFTGCDRLCRVTFGSSSLLERIGISCFEDTSLGEITIPDSVRELCDECFISCERLCRVTFGSSSSLERIGISCFEGTSLGEISIPDSVRELGDWCFAVCKSLRHVIFGSSSRLEKIGRQCFGGCGLVEFEIPRSVREISGGAFGGCASAEGVICRDGCRFRAFAGFILSDDCVTCHSSYGILKSVCIPDSVRDLCDECFRLCPSLCRVIFGSSSQLEKIGRRCFAQSGLFEFEIPSSVREIGGGAFSECELRGGAICRDGCRFRAVRRFILSDDCLKCCCSYGILTSVCIPDSVRDLCDECFKEYWSLRCVKFGSSSCLERIGISCFEDTSLESIIIPDSVRELCDRCFAMCPSLGLVTFGSSSRLERIGVSCFVCTHFEYKWSMSHELYDEVPGEVVNGKHSVLFR